MATDTPTVDVLARSNLKYSHTSTARRCWRKSPARCAGLFLLDRDLSRKGRLFSHTRKSLIFPQRLGLFEDMIRFKIGKTSPGEHSVLLVSAIVTTSQDKIITWIDE
jgi:hypothetical protein